MGAADKPDPPEAIAPRAAEGENAYEGRCGSCARFVRAYDRKDDRGNVRRAGECLLGVWPPPLFADNTCVKYVLRGTFTARPVRAPGSRGKGDDDPVSPDTDAQTIVRARRVTAFEELADMDANEFRQVLRDVLREELGATESNMVPRWRGGELVIKPGKEGTADKRVPIDAFFRKIVMVRDKLRVLEQRINSNASLTDDEKIQMQSYVTAVYGSLTTFDFLFSEKEDQFVGQKGKDE